MTGRERNVFAAPAFLHLDYLCGASMYPWPDDGVMNEALEIAMDYLEGTGRAYPYSEKQSVAADAILGAWRAGVRNKIRLANYAIIAVERKPDRELVSFYPKIS